MAKDEWEVGAEFFLAAHGVENFTAGEVCAVGKVEENATLYAPPADLMPNALKLIEGPLVWIRGHEGTAPITVNSWYRSDLYNQAVGGSENSMHLTAGAADINKSGWTPERVALALHSDYPSSGKLGIGLYQTFVHVDIRGFIGRKAPARWSGDGVGQWWT